MSLEADLQRAAQLESEQPAQAVALYRQILAQDVGNIAAHNALERMAAPGCHAEWMRVNCQIHPQDDIYRFFAEYPGCHDPIRAYLSDGWRSLAELMLVLERVDRSLIGLDSMLEFAAGHGRFTRHLAPLLPGRLTCAEVVPAANAFLAEQFDVDTVDSSLDPEQLNICGEYELVFALSLFTHLPPAQWQGWLKALGQRVAPGGLLIFTVHNEGRAEAMGAALDQGGTCFVPSSESNALSAENYGTTHTSRAFVAQQVEQVFGAPPLQHQELAFWAAQDAVIVASQPQP